MTIIANLPISWTDYFYLEWNETVYNIQMIEVECKLLWIDNLKWIQSENCVFKEKCKIYSNGFVKTNISCAFPIKCWNIYTKWPRDFQECRLQLYFDWGVWLDEFQFNIENKLNYPELKSINFSKPITDINNYNSSIKFNVIIEKDSSIGTILILTPICCEL